MDFARYRKFFVALLGVGVLVAGQLGLGVTDAVSDPALVVFDSVVGLLTALGVRQVAND